MSDKIIGLSGDELDNLITKTFNELMTEEKIKTICEKKNLFPYPGKEEIGALTNVTVYMAQEVLPCVIKKIVNENNIVITKQIEELFSSQFPMKDPKNGQ